MDPERWRRVEALLDRALDLEPDARVAFLARECADERTLIDEVSAILAAGERDDSMLEGSAVRVAAPMLVETTVRMPERVGAYRIERMLGEGGMGTVYLAHRDDGHFDQRVALKVVRRGLHLDARIVRRFRDERQILAALQHPGIARLLDGGLTDDGLPFFAMEFVDGEPIDRYCVTRGLGIDRRLELFVRVCDALAHAHDRQIIHRDIKPSNLLVTEPGAPHLLDFGIAKLLAIDTDRPLRPATRATERLLTPEYASPEQIRGEPLTTASDVYALGVLLYELLTEQRPFHRARRTPHDLERAVLDEEPTRPSEAAQREPVRRRLKGDLDAIVLTAMCKEPGRRYASAAEMGDDVRRHLARQPIAARGADRTYRVRRWVRRHRAAVIVGIATFAVAATAAGVALRVVVPARVALGAATRIPVDLELALDGEISPDGRRLAFVAGTGRTMRLYVRELATGRVTALGTDVPGFHREPRWAPDGRHLALMADGRIWDVRLDGASTPLVAPDAGTPWVGFPAWAPDGRALAYVHGAAVVVRDLARGTQRTLAGAPRSPHSLRWSPDGRFLALVSGNTEFAVGAYPWVSLRDVGNAGQSSIWVLPLAGGPASRVSDGVGRALNAAPVWAPRTRAILYVSNRDGTRDVYRVPLDEHGARAGEPQRLTTGLLTHTLSISADGRMLAFSAFRISANVWQATASATGTAPDGEPVPVTRGVQSVEGLALSPDGRTLAFDSDWNGNHDVYTVPTTGGEPRRITRDPLDEFMPSWSPDGRFLAFHAFERDGTRHLRVVPVDGGPATSVTTTPINQRQPAWSPSADALAFDAGHESLGDVYVVERAGGAWATPRQVAANGVTVRWAPNGRDLLFLRPGGIWVTTRTGAPPRQVVRVAAADTLRLGNADWSRDGARIFFKRFDGDGRTSFWVVPAAGGTPRLVVQLTRDLRSHRAEFATDGTHFYFTATDRSTELWTAELRAVR